MDQNMVAWQALLRFHLEAKCQEQLITTFAGNMVTSDKKTANKRIRDVYYEGTFCLNTVKFDVMGDSISSTASFPYSLIQKLSGMPMKSFVGLPETGVEEIDQKYNECVLKSSKTENDKIIFFTEGPELIWQPQWTME